jgi:serine/threonine-protein kinase HipA
MRHPEMNGGISEKPAALLVQLRTAAGQWVAVGHLCHLRERSWFQTLDSYWDAVPRPVLGQIFEERGSAWRPSQAVTLPTWFSHLLPEGRLRDAVASAARVNPAREFFLLARIGTDDLPGAMRVRPSAVADSDHEHAAEEFESPVGDGAEESPLLKFSLAGVQLKFSVRLQQGRGLTIPAEGQAGDWIVKLADERPDYQGVPEVEFAALELARAAGIAVPEAFLADVKEIAGISDWATARGGRALAVRRFDRTPNDGRVHVEQLAQILDIPTSLPRAKYVRANFETIASVVSALCGPGSVGEIIDRLVLNVLVGNGDAHLKNWAVCYPDGHRAVLSPAYDIVPTVLFLPGDDLGLKLNGSRSFHDVTTRSFDRLARRAGWTEQEARARVREAVDRVVGAWAVLADHLPADSARRLVRRRDALPLVRGT